MVTCHGVGLVKIRGLLAVPVIFSLSTPVLIDSLVSQDLPYVGPPQCGGLRWTRNVLSAVSTSSRGVFFRGPVSYGRRNEPSTHVGEARRRGWSCRTRSRDRRLAPTHDTQDAPRVLLLE